MADEKIVTSIVANSDFSNLIADVQRVTSSLFKLQQEFAGSNRALAGQINATNAMFKETMLKTGQFSSHFVSLTSDVEKFGRNLDSGRLKLKDYFRAYQENARTSGGLIKDLAKQQVQLQNAILQPLGKNAQGLMQYNVHVPRGLDLTKNKAALLKQELQIMNKVIQDGGVQLINWGKNTQWAGRQLTVGLTLPLVAFGKAAADAFRVADQELTRLTKVYGDIAGSSAQELNKIRQEVSATAKELSSSMGVNFAETISLAADIAATGKTGNELLSSVSETTRLAVLGEVDRQEAMKATLAIQSAFKANTQELSESINFLNAVENQTSTTLNDLVEAIPKAGPVIKGLGGSVQDLALYLTAMREGGINASEGANALKSALASLINPTDKAVEKFKGFGIDLLGIVQKNAGDVTGTLFALQSALDQLDPLSKQQAIEQLFGKFQFSRLNALFENLGRQGSQTLQVLDLMKASAGELEAVAGRELAQVTESAAGRYRRAIESLKADLAGVGDEFLNIGTKLINVLDKVIQFGQKLPDPLKKIIAFGGAFTAIIGPVIMLTGVLANFFGYIIKGIGHFKALFKGAEGFRLLTPEIIAARAAAGQLTDEFYSDAKATDTLSLAIKKLNEDLLLLQKNATAAKTSVSGLGQTITTAAGTPIATVGGPRVVDPTNPLLGGMSRAAAHLNPRNPNDPSTIFGLTMQPIPVNRRIGANPQILMEERLPDVPGLTVVNKASTGVVAGEHARYAALMATLGLQSKREIQELKKTIAMGGQVSADFIATFDDILPITQTLTQNAARQSAAIVAELKAGKLNVQQARDAIIAVNAQLEREMGAQITAYGAATGRTIDLTKAPLIDQPIVDPSGKPNTRGMFRKGIFSRVMTAVGRATRTRTVGGPYSIETTKPTGFNAGGQVFNSPSVVPGPNVNADVVPAMLTPGEFVVNREATAANLPLLMAINGNRQAGANNSLGGFMSGRAANAILSAFGVRSRSQRPARLLGNWGMLLPNLTNQRLARSGALGAELRMLVGQPQRQIDLMRFLSSRGVPENEIRRVANRVSSNLKSRIVDDKKYTDTEFGNLAFSVIDPEIVALEASYPGIRLAYQKDRMQPGRRDTASSSSRHGPSPSAVNVPGGRGSSYGSGTGGDVWAHYSDLAFEENIKSIASSMGYRFNSGGLIPGYQDGGGPIQRPGMGSMLGGMLLQSAGWMGGSALGSRFGTAGSMVGGMLGSMLAPALMGGMGGFGRQQDPSIYATKLDGLKVAQYKWAQSAVQAAGQGKMWGRVLTGLASGLTKTNLIIGAGVGVISLAVAGWKKYNETQRISAAAFGLTAQSAEKAGLKFTDYNTKIKDAIAAQKLMIDQNTLTYESLQSAGTPFKMTIAEYKKLREELKATMEEQIKVINATSSPDVARVAVQLKEQLMAAGLSAEEAAKRIYTLFNLSNKAGQAVSVINTDAFRQIVDAQTAAASALQSFNYAKNFENTRDAAAALNTALTAINTGIEDLIGKSEEAAKKKGKDFDATAAAYDAEKKQLDLIASKVKSQEAIGQEVLNNLKEQNPEIEKFVNAQDNAVSIFHKLRLVARGFTGDLASLNAQQAEAVYKLQIATSKAVTNVNQKGLLSEQYKAYNSLRKEIQELEKAAKGQSVKEQINARDAIKAIDAKIKKINEEADARKKALREEASAQDLNLRIQQQKLEYENRVSAGDFGGAAQAQLELARLVNEQQTVISEQQIEDKRLRDIAPLEKQREALANAQEKIADKAALAAESLESMNKRLATQKDKIDAVNEAMTNLKVALELNKDNLEKFKTSEEFKGLAGRLVEAIRGTGQVVANTSLPDVAQGRLQENIGQMASDVMSKYGAGIDTIIAQQGVRVNATGDIIIDGKRIDMKEGSREIPAPSSAQLAAAGRVSTGQLVFDTKTGKWTFDTGSIDPGMISYSDYKSGKIKYAGGGLLRGPGTRTSDSILGMYANGGMVRVSNGEYVINADTVSRLGVPFFDRINRMKNGGLMLNYDIPRYGDGGAMIQTMPYKSEGLYNINNSFTINAADGMNVDELVNKVAAKVETVTARAISKVGPERNISKRYNSGKGVR